MLVHAANPAMTKSFGEGDFRGSPVSLGISEMIFTPPQDMDVLNSTPQADETALPLAVLHNKPLRQRTNILGTVPDRPGVSENTPPL